MLSSDWSRPIKRILREILSSFGLRVIRIENEQIGMRACLEGLRRRGFSPKNVIDIGAARGDWTTLALLSWPETSYLLIEPLMEHLEELRALKLRHPNIDYVIAAAGPEEGDAVIGVSKELDSSSLLYPGESSRVVPVVKIDTVLQERKFGQPEFMKLDVQGYELKVLEGATESIARCDLILLEVQFYRFAPAMKLFHETIRWMVDRGFRPYEIVDVMRRPYDGAMGQCDLLFAREGSRLLGSNAW